MPQPLALFAVTSLGIIESLAAGSLTPSQALQTFFHVRNGGWMGASLTYEGPRTITLGKRLLLKYGLYIHRGMASTKQLEQVWRGFAMSTVMGFPEK